MEQSLENNSKTAESSDAETTKGAEISECEEKVVAKFVFRPINIKTFCSRCGKKADFIGESLTDKWKAFLCEACVSNYLALNSP